jgi:hypothetical protein
MKRKLKGIKFKRVDGVIYDGPQIKCKDGTLSYSHLGCENRGGVAVPIGDCGGPFGCGRLPKPTDPLLYSPVYGYGDYTPEPKIPEPTSQADCPDGTTFSPSYIAVAPTGIGAARIPAECKEPKISQPKSCEQQYADYLVWLQENGPRIKIKPETKEEFMAKCEGKSATPTVQGNVQNALQSLMDKNWLLPAIAIGVGVYLITRKS